MATVNIYVLLLNKDKYYVGRSSSLITDSRILDHFSSHGSQWTRIYKPIEVIKIYQNCSPFDEDRYTKEYMSIYGIDNVRGGTYCRVILDKIEIACLEREIRGASDSCYFCGQKNHFVKDCKKRLSEERESEIDEPKLHIQKSNVHFVPGKTNFCHRCARKGHYSIDCYATHDIYRNEIINGSAAFCLRCARKSHAQNNCFATKDIYGNII